MKFKYVSNLEKNIYPDQNMGSVRGNFLHHPDRINQDSCATYYTEKGFRVGVLGDGMGGHASGDKWSSNLIAFLYTKRDEISDALDTLQKRPSIWNRYFEHIIGEFISTMKSYYPDCDGGTTLIYCHEIEPNVFVSLSVGDSPLYLVADRVASQQFKLDDMGPTDFSGRITNCVGFFDDFRLTQDTKLVVLGADSQLMMVSDGFSDNISAEAVADISHDFEFFPQLLEDMQVDLDSGAGRIPDYYRTGYTDHYGRMKPDDIALAFIKFRRVFIYADGFVQANLAPIVTSGPFLIDEHAQVTENEIKPVDEGDFEEFSVTDFSE